MRAAGLPIACRSIYLYRHLPVARSRRADLVETNLDQVDVDAIAGGLLRIN